MSIYKVVYDHPAGHLEIHTVEAPNQAQAVQIANTLISNAVRNTPPLGRKASRLRHVRRG